jgi:hypothetical protein
MMGLDRAGLLLNFVGSVLIAFSINRLPSEAYQEVKGRKVQIAAVLHPARSSAGALPC